MAVSSYLALPSSRAVRRALLDRIGMRNTLLGVDRFGDFIIVVPTHDLVIVQRGLDYGRQGFNRWDLTREVRTTRCRARRSIR